MRTIIFILILCSTISGHAQLENNSDSKYAAFINTPTPQERYKVDYEIADYIFINGDSTVLDLLNLDSLENMRSQANDIEVIDTATGLTVILYFEKRRKEGFSNTIKLEE